MSDVLDQGPFFHGTKADLRMGELEAWRDRLAASRADERGEIIN